MAGGVFYREPRHDYPLAMRGEGVYLYDSDGRQYLDGSGGAAVSALGHSHPRVLEAIRSQVDELAFAHTAFFTNEPQEQLAQRLADRFGSAGARVYFLAGGSEANEAAMKLARQYWVARGEPERSVFISRNQSYHGNTLGALALSGYPGRREVYKPILADWPKIDPCFPYRFQQPGESEEEYGARCADSLQQEIDRQGAGKVAAFVAETVSGATLAAAAAANGYFKRVREICDRNDILLILDEVMAGSGRTGTYFAFEQEGITPDIVTIAKGLGGGYQPLGAMICGQKIYDTVVDAYGEFSHGHTYVGHATACAAGLAVQQVMDEDDLLSNVRERGAELMQGLGDALAEHPHVGDIRGRGLFVGIELVADRDSKAPAPAELKLPALLRKRAMAEGLVCYPGGGTADGKDGAHILLAPPYIFSSEHVGELIGKISAVLGDVVIER